MPLRKNSTELSYADLNLWLLDERLSFHVYLASDLPLHTSPAIEIDSAKEPDIVVFNKVIALADSEKPYSSLVIVEFKRPMRKN